MEEIVTDEILAKAEEPKDSDINNQSSEQSDMLHKTIVSKIVERERLKAFEKGKKEAMAELQNQQEMQQAAPIQQVQPAQSIGGMPQLTQEQIEQMIMQKAPEALMQQVNQMKQQSLVNSFVEKMQSAEQRYPGLEDKLNKLNYNDARMHKLIEMTNNLDNTGDIINELVTNPHKMSVVLSDIIDQPFLAQQQLASLSNSIKQNQQAIAEEAQAKSPMSQLKPSINSGMADNSNLSIEDLQRMLSQRK